MSSVHTSAIDNVSFFDDMISKIPSVYRKQAEEGRGGIHQKFHHKKGGYEMATYKKKRIVEEEVAEEESEDDDDEEEKSGKFVMPANYATIDTLRDRLKQKIAEQRPCAVSLEDKKAKRAKEDARAKAKKKVRKQKEREHGKDAKKQRLEAKEASKDAKDQEVVTLDKTSTVSKETDIGFAVVTASAMAKDFDKVLTGANAKGTKEKQLRKLERFHEKVESLESSGKGDAAAQLKHNKAMSSALARATGEIVKDDMRLLKKTLKRKEKSKGKSQEFWKDKLAKQDQQIKESRAAKDVRINKKIEEKLAKKKGTFVKAKKSDKKKDDKGGKKKFSKK